MSERAVLLLAEILEAQQQTNYLLTQLIRQNQMMLEALASESEDGEQLPATYMDGSPVR